MNYEWDENKRQANIIKHGVDFSIAEDFEWETAFETIDDRHDYSEVRWVALGYIKNHLYDMIYTRRFDNIRIISLEYCDKHSLGIQDQTSWTDFEILHR